MTAKVSFKGPSFARIYSIIYIVIDTYILKKENIMSLCYYHVKQTAHFPNFPENLKQK